MALKVNEHKTRSNLWLDVEQRRLTNTKSSAVDRENSFEMKTRFHHMSVERLPRVSFAYVYVRGLKVFEKFL